MTELTEVMRQRDDMTFIQLLNKIKVGDIDDFAESILKEQYMEEDNYQKCILHMFAENTPVKDHNYLMFTQLNSPVTSVKATDSVRERQQPSPVEILSLKSRKLKDSGNLTYMLQLKIGAKVMLAAKIDISHTLTNDKIGAVISFQMQM